MDVRQYLDPRWANRCCRYGRLAALLLGLIANRAMGGSGQVDTLPQNPPPSPNGIQLRIDTRWIDGNGYRPVRVVLATQPLRPSANQRRFRVELSHYDRIWSSRQRPALRVTDELVLEQGQTSVAKSIAVPQWSPVSVLHVKLFEGGDELEEFTGVVNGTAANFQWTEVGPTVLVVTSAAPDYISRGMYTYQLEQAGTNDLPDVHQLVAQLPGSPTYGSSMLPDESDGRIWSLMQQVSRVAIIAPADLPRRWVELSAVDLVFISWTDLQQLARRDAQQFAALRHWNAAGATLVVSGLADSGVQRAELVRLLGMSRRLVFSPQAAGDSGEATDYWQMPAQAHYQPKFLAAEQLAYNQVFAESAMADTPDATVPQSAPGPAPEEIPPAKFRLGRSGLGNVIACDDEDPFDDLLQLTWMLNSIDRQDWAWLLRYGMSLNRANHDVGNFLIPGVGRPPVFAFLVLLTGFVVLIGPVNYFTLRRRRRLYLLLVTVPVAALVATTLLLAYGILSDGIHVRVRTRSYTRLNQHRQEHVTWSRQSYYAGLRPSRGLVFGDDTLVLPIDPVSKNFRVSHNPLRYVVEWSRGQVLRSGYLEARQPAQMLLVQSGPQPAHVDIRREGAELTARNELGGLLELLVARDATGNWYWAESVAVGRPAVLRKTDKTQVVHRLSLLMPGLPTPASVYGYTWGDVDQNLPEPTTRTSVLERNLRRVAQGELAPGTFLAVMDGAEWLPIGVEATSQASVHVVEGWWSARGGEDDVEQ